MNDKNDKPESAEAQPGEWVLVPREPTRDMVEAGIMFGTSPNAAAIIFQSMVHAAPQPPAEAQAQGGGEVVAEVKEVDVYEQHGRGWHKDARILPTGHMPDVGTKLYTAPPIAPVGVEELRGAVARGWCTPENARKAMDVELAEAIVKEVAALTQQPAAVDGAIREAAERLVRKAIRQTRTTTSVFTSDVEAVRRALAAQPGGSDNDR